MCAAMTKKLLSRREKLGFIVHLNRIQGTECVGKVSKVVFLLEEVPQLARL